MFRLPMRRTPLTLLMLLLLVGIGACGPRNQAGEKLAKDTQEAQKFDSNLTFNNVTLEQANDKGQLWWKVKAKQATYSKDQKNAVVVEPRGELFQDGKPVFKIEAQKSDIQQDGKSIFLKGQITATDVRDGTVMKGNEVEWRPTEDVLIVRNNFTGDHKQMQLAAKEGRFQSRTRKVDVKGQIVALVKEPSMELKTEHLVWDLQQQKIVGDQPVQLQRFKNKVPTDQGSANKADVDLKGKIVNFRENAKIAVKESNLQVSGNLLTWKMDTQTVQADQPVTIVNPAQQVTLTANSGSLDIQQQIAKLNGNVRGTGEKNQSRLGADRAVWYLTTQQFEAEGNVTYNQANPPFSMAGPRASGKLDDQQVAVKGDDSGRVELQIVPQSKQ
jgi:LPS export ABC transporter protein LptC